MNEMRIMSFRDAILSVADRWDAQYSRGYTLANGEKAAAISAKLRELDLETCSAAAVSAIVGNNSWVGNACDQCNQERDVLLRIGDEPDYDARYLDLCVYCLRVALSKAEGRS